MKPLSDEVKKKISDSLKGHRPWSRGRVLTEDQKRAISNGLKGKYVGENNPLFGRHLPEKTKRKIGAKSKGNQHRLGKPAWNKGIPCSEETKQKISASVRVVMHTPTIQSKTAPTQFRTGTPKEKHPRWNGGEKASIARQNNIRADRGFLLLTLNNPYNEPTEYHHIMKGTPYVVPCPKRIHRMFNGAEKTHMKNVNMFLGIFGVEELPEAEVKYIAG